MIKNLKNKFLICLFLLVTIFSVTSSCFAATFLNEILEAPFTLDDLYTSEAFQTKFSGIDLKNINVFSYYTGSWSVKVFANSNVSYYKVGKTSTSSTDKSYSLWAYDSNDTKITNLTVYSFRYSVDAGFEYYTASSGTDSILKYGYSSSSITNFGNVLTSNLYDSSGNLWFASVPPMSVNVTHEFQSDTSAKVNFIVNNAPNGAYLQYSLTGIEPNINLNAPIQLRNPITYTPGVTNLIVKPNTKVYWALYDSNGDVLDTNVYQVPEYDSVIENADKSIEYSVTYNEDNSLATLTVNVVNGEFSDKLYYTENGMVSNDYAGKQLFPASKTLQIDHNCNMHIILYDPFDNLITAKYVTINKIGSIPEQNFKVDVTTGDKTVYVRPRLYNILQSRFYSIEYDVILDTFTASKDIELHQDGVYVGKVTDTSQTHTCGSDSELKFYQNIGTSNITVTFRIINAETGETCITRTVSFKIGLDDESTGVTDSTTNGVTDNSFITSGTNSNYSDVANMGISDYYNMVNTNNTAWSFFKVILNSLPNWITLPLSLLIFGVVTITLYRFIRGA